MTKNKNRRQETTRSAEVKVVRSAAAQTYYREPINDVPPNNVPEGIARLVNRMRSMLGNDHAWFTTTYEEGVKLVGAVSMNDKHDEHHAFIDNGSNILAVAHMDSVAKVGKPHLSRRLFWSPTVDNRIGFWLITRLLPKLGVEMDVLLTDHEESCSSTSSYFKVPDGKKYNWIVQFDRMGGDVALYQYDSPEVRELVRDVGMVPVMGSYTCIANMDALGIKGFNWGVGYQDYHGPNARVDLYTLANNVVAFLKFYERNAGTMLEHKYEPRQYHRSYAGWGSWEDWGDWGLARTKYGSYSTNRKFNTYRPKTKVSPYNVLTPTVCSVCEAGIVAYEVRIENFKVATYVCPECAHDILSTGEEDITVRHVDGPQCHECNGSALFVSDFEDEGKKMLCINCRNKKAVKRGVEQFTDQYMKHFRVLRYTKPMPHEVCGECGRMLRKNEIGALKCDDCLYAEMQAEEDALEVTVGELHGADPAAAFTCPMCLDSVREDETVWVNSYGTRMKVCYLCAGIGKEY